MKYHVVLIVTAFLTAGAGSAFAQAAKCSFTYNDKIRDQLVLPALRAKEGAMAKSYDWQWPDLMTGPQRIEITFSLNNAHPVTAPDFLVVIDPCKRSVISAKRIPHVIKNPAVTVRQFGE